MSNDKLVKLQKYLTLCRDRVEALSASSVPREVGTREFFKREVAKTERIVADLKLTAGGK